MNMTYILDNLRTRFVIAAIGLAATILGSQHMKAQGGEQAVTSVNIILADVISVDVESVASVSSVDFNYAGTADYNSAKNVTVPNSLVVISSRNFDVKVKSEGANFVSGTNTIPVDVLQVKAVPGGTLQGTMNEVTLSTADQVLVSNAGLGSKQSLNIAYSISAKKAANVLLGKPKGTYVQKIIYTATAL